MQREADRGFVRVSTPRPRRGRRRLARLNLALIAGLLLSLLSLNATQSFVARNSAAAAGDGHAHTHDHGGKLQAPSRVNRADSPYALQKPSPSRNADLVTAAGEPMVTSLAAAATPDTAGQWSPLLDWPLVAVHTALLPNGNVLMWEAWELPDTPSVRVWNPTTQQFVSTPHPTSAIFCAGQAMLADGRQFVVGGMLDNSKGIKHSSIFDPATNKWTRKANMAYARWYPTTVTLGDGRVLTLGGQITPNVYAQIPEIYNPQTNTWTSLTAAKLNVGEYQELNAFVLPNGKVLINAAKDGITRTLDPNTQKWTAYGRSPAPDGTAAMFRPGKLLVTGGGGLERNGTGPTVNTSAVLDMTQPAPAWRVTAPMASVRDQHNLVLLPDGKVFAVGGATTDIFHGALAAEIWDPATETWTTMASMAQPRMYHSTALLLPDGRVLVAGGGREGAAPDYLTAQIYSPPYLSQGARPTIASAPAATTYGSSMTVGTPDAANIASAAFVRLGSNTHTVNFDQRYIPLDFTQTAGGLTIQSPADANTAPPGYYMLFIVDGNGVPSVSKMVQLGGTSTTPPPTPTPTNTPVPPTPTSTPTGGTATPTNTPVPPTNTPVPPTNTPVPPTPTSTPTAGAGLAVYDNAIRNGFSDGSYNYSALNWCNGTTNTSAPCGIGITFQGYGTLSFRHAGANTSSYSRFEFDFNPQGRPIAGFGVLLVTTTGAVNEVGLASNYVTPLANGWVRVSIPLAELNPSNGLVVEVDISNYASTSIPAVYFDEIKFR